jgi:RNA polymerase sigma factor (sigma-70 family)
MSEGAENLTDEELILLYKKAGDVTTLGRLYDPYMPMVYGVCLKYLKSREESRDAVMHIFEKLVTILKSHEVTHFKSWLYVTTKNHCLMILRSNKSRKLHQINEGIMEMEEFAHPDYEDDLEINMIRLEKCIDELSAEQKQCVQLFFLQQKCYKEITTLTGFDDGKVKSYIQNGKRNLKICMERNA